MKNQNNYHFELLSPGGDFERSLAAIAAGANAIYTGLKQFNARRKAGNLDLVELKKLFTLAHKKGVKIYITLNVLITELEIEKAIGLAELAIAEKVDGIIVQDAGLAFVLKERFPTLSLHASTQMTTHNLLQLDYLHRSGFSQVNFSRELSATELKPLIARAHQLEMKAEVFVHGAYCICTSGICYMSSSISAQPGNRGACLQPCRKKYGLPGNSSSDKEYLLSLKDNTAIDHIETLAEIGVDTLKIEGRIKSAAYVYEVTKSWREKITSYLAKEKQQNEPIHQKISYPTLPGASKDKIHTVFNRGFHAGYLTSKISKEMFVDSPLDQSLTPVGTVLSYSADQKLLVLESKADLLPNDEITIYSSDNFYICGAEVKGVIDPRSYEIEIENKLKGKILRGQCVMALRNGDRRSRLLDEINRLKQEIGSSAPVSQKGKIELSVTVKGEIGKQVQFLFHYKSRNDEKIEFLAESDSVALLAAKSGLDETLLTAQLGRLGNTPFVLGPLTLTHLAPSLFIPLSELNKVRRSAVEYFEKKGILLNEETESVDSSAEEVGESDFSTNEANELALTLSKREENKIGSASFPTPSERSETSSSTHKKLAILISEPEDLDLWEGLTFIDCASHKILGNVPKATALYVPPVLYDSETAHPLKCLEQIEPKLVISENIGLGLACQDKNIPWISGAQLNASNGYTFDAYKKYGGASGGFYSTEIHRDQINAIHTIDNFSTWMNVFGPVTLMTTRQCLFQRPGLCKQKKTETDTNCLQGCKNYATWSDEKNIPFHAVKELGYPSRLFNGSYLFLPEAIYGTNGQYFLIDLRTMPFQPFSKNQKREIIAYFKSVLSGERSNLKDNELELKRMLGSVTRGNYNRGFEC